MAKPMFGCTAVYVGEKIVLILREKEPHDQDCGIWIATTVEHHESLKNELPGMRSIKVFESEGPTGWQVLRSSSPDFEEEALKACELILEGDERIGKIPARKNKKATKKKNAKRKKPATKKTARK